MTKQTFNMAKAYNRDVEILREREYPHMNSGVYLDHSGATIYAKSLIDAFSMKMVTNLYGNPHSENSPAKLSGDVVDEVRLKTLNFLGANPDDFDLIFVANATAAIKLVAECFRDLGEKTREKRFWYGCHKDAHTSLVGIRELTHGQSHCFESDQEVERWIQYPETSSVNRHDPNGLGLFAYPGQSNMSGRRLPLSWAGLMRNSDTLQSTYTLLDAAALAMTSPMDRIFRDADQAPDFTCLSLYKIFGFPDLGALVVRRQSGHILALRKYFGGGTVTMVGTLGDNWHRSKGLQAPDYKLHEGLEDGTLPFHSILALGEAIDVHRRLYGSMGSISGHTSYLVARLYRDVAALRHVNGRPVCRIYNENNDSFEDPTKQGSVIAFNVLQADGQHVPYSEVESLANAAGIFIRSGGVCNPGGIFTALGYEPWMAQRALSAGHQCGSHGIGIIHKRPTGIVRVSLGAMSTRQDADIFVDFLRSTFVEGEKMTAPPSPTSTLCSVPGDNFSLYGAGDYSTKALQVTTVLPRRLVMPSPATPKRSPPPIPNREGTTLLSRD